VSELSESILGCSYGGQEVVFGDVARDGTECVLEEPTGAHFLICRSGTWSQQSSNTFIFVKSYIYLNIAVSFKDVRSV